MAYISTQILTNIGADVPGNIVWKGCVCGQRKCAEEGSLCCPNKRKDNRPKGSKTSTVRKRFIRFWSPLIYYLGTKLSTTVLLSTKTAAIAIVCGSPPYCFYIRADFV